MRFAGTQLTNFMDPTNFDAIGKASINGQSLQNRASMMSEAYVDRADIKALADIESAKFGASATRAQGEAQGQSSMWSGLSNGIGSLAGGIANMPTGGGNNYGLPAAATAPTQTGVNHFSLDSMMADFQQPGFRWPGQ
jgi:hypothetical protein